MVGLIDPKLKTLDVFGEHNQVVIIIKYEG